MKEQDLVETMQSSNTVFEGCLLRVCRDVVTLPNGRCANRELIRHVGAVCVIPVTEDGRVVIERQYRYPIEQVITEIPAGKLNSKSEDRLEAAKRELREETGLTAEHWEDMGLYYPAPAYSDEKITMFLATGLHFGTQELDEDEFLHVETRPLTELVSEVLKGVITDGKTQIALLKAALLLAKR